MNTDRAATNLVAVADNVVSVSQCVSRILVKGVEPFGLWRSEGVVNCRPRTVSKRNVTFGLGISGRLEQRRVNNPGERPRIGIDEVAPLTDFQTSGAKQLARGGRLTGSKEDAVTGLGASCLGEASAFGVGNVLCNRAAQVSFVVDRDVSQALCAARLGPFLPFVEGTARLRATTGHNNRTDVRCLENTESRVLEVVGQVNKLVPETQVRLIRTILLHGIFEGHARNRSLKVIANERPDILHDLFGNCDHVVLIDEAHFDIKLGKLGLAISTEVLITVATRDLEVAFHSGDHQHLLEKLRRLRKRVPRTGSQTCRNNEVTRTFGCGTCQRRRFNFDEIVSVKSIAGRT